MKQIDRRLMALLLFAFVVRCGLTWIRRENLTVDRDAYLAIAENLMAGNGFCSVTGYPTAFRPPLYPLLLAGCLAIGGKLVIAAVHIALGTATVALTWLLARRTGFSERAGLLAGLLTAVDPLLLEHGTQPMTETLFTFLSTALLCVLTSPAGTSLQRPVLSGVLLGLAGLCRPSIWAFVLLWLTFAIGSAAVQRLRRCSRGEREPLSWRPAAALLATALLVVSPWAVRNWLVFGRPIVMTTHGGYTLALGNNQRFYSDVVAGPERVWSAEHLARWQREAEATLAADGIELSDEVAHDAGMSRLAVDWIRQHPREFLQASWLRVTRLWAVSPHRGVSSAPQILNSLVAIWYSAVLMFALAGVIRHRRCWRGFLPGLLLIASLTILHAVYWSNMRMRCPSVPVMSLLAVSCASQRRLREPAIRDSAAEDSY
ncbi:MAG: ArnT family glycosyltransferase [Planctomycetota bacterium]